MLNLYINFSFIEKAFDGFVIERQNDFVAIHDDVDDVAVT